MRSASARAFTLGVVSSFMVGSAQAQARRASSANNWYLITIGGTSVGWLRDSREETAAGIRVASDMRIVLNRLGTAVVMESAEHSAEGRNGQLETDSISTRLSDQATTQYVTVTGNKLRIITRAGAQSFERGVDLSNGLLGPDAARKVSSTRLQQIGDSLQYDSFAGSIGAPVSVTRVLMGIDTVVTPTGPERVRRIVERSKASSVPVTLWLDTAGRLVREAYDSPFGRTESVLTDSVSAFSANGGGALAASQYERTLVKTNFKIPQARRVERLRLELSVPDSAFEWPNLSGPGQTVVRQSGNTLLLDVRRSHAPVGHHTFPVARSPAIDEYLTANTYVQSADPAARQLALRIIGRETDLYRASLALERWASENMKFDLGVAFAPSSEILERRRGTCVAFATLLATLTRAVGIPSRVAFGYVYVNGIFGGHAWTEVLAGREWIPIDAAITAAGPADAARFAFAWSSLLDGPGSLTSSPGSQLYGLLSARVVDVSINGRDPLALRYDGGAPYEVQGDTYRNAWLGIEAVKPPTFSFAALDETWPDMTILGMDGPNGERVRVSSLYRDPWTTERQDAVSRLRNTVHAHEVRAVAVAGRTAWQIESTNHAAIAIPYGGETLVIAVTAPRAADLLARITAKFTLKHGALSHSS